MPQSIFTCGEARAAGASGIMAVAPGALLGADDPDLLADLGVQEDS